jgi:DNA-binding transcriptional MerR regulator
MLKIGDFSKLAQVSTRTLRYYDELGLLKPRIIDSGSGYRYYEVQQLARLNRILALKDLGLGLEEITALVEAEWDAAHLHDMLVAQERELEQRMRADAERLLRVRERLKQIEEEEAPFAIDVVIKAIEAQVVVGNRMIIPTQMDLMYFCTHMLAEVYRWLKHHSIPHQPTQLILYHAQEFVERDFDTEVAVVLSHDLYPLPPLPHAAMRVFHLPPAPTMATTLYQGLLRQSTATIRELVRWTAQQGYGYPEDGLMLREVHLLRGDDLTQSILAEGTVEFQLPVIAPRL